MYPEVSVMIRIGLLGCGFMGGMHAACYEALSPERVQVTALSDMRASFAEDLSKRTGATVFPDPASLIASADVDAIDICLPTFLHTRYALAAMKAGKDVFIEKPVCLHPEEMQQLLDAERESGRQVQIGQVLRFWNEYVWLKNAVQQETYGAFRSGSFYRLSAAPTWSQGDWYHDPELSGGLVVDMHVHDVDFVRHLLGDPDQVRAQAHRDSHGLISQIFSSYSYGTNAAVSIEASWDHPQSFPFTAGYCVRLEKAAAVYKSGRLMVYPDHGDPFVPRFAEIAEGSADAGGNISSLAGYYDELKYFVEGLEGMHPLQRATLADSIASVRLVQREIEAAGGLLV